MPTARPAGAADLQSKVLRRTIRTDVTPWCRSRCGPALVRATLLALLAGGMVGIPAALAATDPMVTVVVSGQGKVDVAPGDLTCQSRCTSSVEAGAHVTLKATPAAGGFVFTGWHGDACSGAVGDTCAFLADGDTTVTAVFAVASVTDTTATTTTTTTITPTEPILTTTTPPTTTPPPPTPPFGTWEEFEKTVASQLTLGSVAFNTPRQLHREETAEIVFLLSPEMSVDELKDQISAAGAVEGTRVNVSNYMQADLTGSSFSITRTSPARQLVLPGTTTRWSWEITPTRTGVLPLHLTLTAILTANGENRELQIRTFDKVLTIHVSWPDKVKDFVFGNWQWLWTAIVVPVAVWAYQRNRRETRTDAEPPKET